MIIPLLPFYAKSFGASGFTVGLLVASFAIAQLFSAPMWGRFSDRYGRRPALMVGLAASAIAYMVFAYADSLWLLFLSRLVQGSGGGTVSVIQAYVADALKPEERAKGLGWLSAATNAGVALGPVLGSQMLVLGPHAPGLAAAVLCVLNMGFAWRYLVESRDMTEARASHASPRAFSRGGAARHHALERTRAAAHLDLRDRHRRLSGDERDSRALPGRALRRDLGDDRILLHVHRHHRGPDARADSRAGGRSVWRSQAVAARSDAPGDRASRDAVHAPDDRPGGVRRATSGAFCRSRRWRCCRSSRWRWPWLCSHWARLSLFRA